MKTLHYIAMTLGALVLTSTAGAFDQTVNDFSEEAWRSTGSAAGAKFLKADGSVATENGADDDTADTFFWTSTAAKLVSEDDKSTVTNDPAIGTIPSRPDAFASDPTYYMNIETEGSVLNRLLTGGVHKYVSETHSVNETAVEIPTAGLYIDTLVQFTASQDVPTTDVDDSKLVLFLLADEDAGETNLCVKAKWWYKDGENVAESNRVFKIGATNAYKEKTWYRLTVKAIQNVTSDNVGTITAFQIFIDGNNTALTTTSGEATMGSDAYAAKEVIEGYQTLFTAGSLFASMADGLSTGDPQLSAVGFQGTGKLTDFVATETTPTFLVQNFTITIADNGNIDDVEYKIDDGDWADYTEPFDVQNGSMVYVRATAKGDNLVSGVSDGITACAGDNENGYEYQVNGAAATLTVSSKLAGAWYTDENGNKVLTETFADAISAANEVGNGAMVTLVQNVTLTSGIQPNGITLNLNGKTIAYSPEDTPDEDAYLIEAEDTTVISNGTITTSYGTDPVSYINAIYNMGDLTLDNVTINAGTALALYSEDATATILSGTYNGAIEIEGTPDEDAGEGQYNESTLTVYGGTFNAAVTKVGGGVINVPQYIDDNEPPTLNPAKFLVSANEDASVFTVTNGGEDPTYELKSNGEEPAYLVLTEKAAGTVLTIAGAQTGSGATLQYSTDAGETWSDVVNNQISGLEAETSVMVKNTVENGAGYMTSNIVRTAENQTLTFAAVDMGWFFRSGDGTEANPYTVTDVAGIKALQAAVKYLLTTAESHFQLAGNVTMPSDTDWAGIGVKDSLSFSGTFDGNGYTISGLRLKGDATYQGFFAQAENATIKNLTMNGVTFGDGVSTNEHGGAAFVGKGANLVISNCTFEGNLATAEHPAKHNTAAFCVSTAQNRGNCSFIDCTTAGNVYVATTNDHAKSAGFVALASTGGANYTNFFIRCSVTGKISNMTVYTKDTSTATDAGNYANLGGLFGYCNSGTIVVRDCDVSAATIEWDTTVQYKSVREGSIASFCTRPLIVEGTTKVPANLLAVNWYGTSVSQVQTLGFATVSDGVATFGAAASGSKVMVDKAAYALAGGASITFDETIATAAVTTVAHATFTRNADDLSAVVYASAWDQFTISYTDDDGTAYDTTTVWTYATEFPLALYAPPTKSNYTFDGWTNATYTTAIKSLETKPAYANMTLVAKWTENAGPTPVTPEEGDTPTVTPGTGADAGKFIVDPKGQSTVELTGGADATVIVNVKDDFIIKGAKTVEVRANGKDISSYVVGTTDDGFSTALDDTKVKNVIDDRSGIDTPFAVGSTADVTINPIPGLTYTLQVSGEVGSGYETASGDAAVKTPESEEPITLKDDDPPAGKGFYKINVSK